MSHRTLFLCLSLFGLLVGTACQQAPTAANQPLPAPTAEVSTVTPLTLYIDSRQGNISKGLVLAAERWEAQTGINIEIEEYAYTYLQEQIFIDTGHSR